MIRSTSCWIVRFLLLAALSVSLQACPTAGERGGGAGTGGTSASATGVGSGGAGPVAGGESLTVAEVEQILAQAIFEAVARGVQGTFAVVDRVGNVLAVFRMDGAEQNIVITSQNPPFDQPVSAGLEGLGQFGLSPSPPIVNLRVPDTLAAIAKAISGAYLSSRGNAFTTRTANQIIQENFNPGEDLAPGGPLFGVQFSQLPCSDLSVRFVSGSPQESIGPKRSPLGFAADPGGLPLYKNGDPVGGIGVITDGTYSGDKNIFDIDTDDDELVALAAGFGFLAPLSIRANRISIEGKTLRFTDKGTKALRSDPTQAPAFVDGMGGVLLPVTAYFDGAIIPGQIFGEPESGIRPEETGLFGDQGAFILVDGFDQNRFPPTDGTPLGGNELTAEEVTTILDNALQIAFRARAQIRRPLNSHAQVSISVVDHLGRVLGIVRTPDAPIFGIDVSLQKARTAAFFSSTEAANQLVTADATNPLDLTQYVDAVQTFIGPGALTDGIAFSDRANGNLSRPFYPDGVNGRANNGPFSLPFDENQNDMIDPGQWSVFNTGLQLDLILVPNLAQHLLFVNGLSANDTPQRCTTLPVDMATGSNRLANGAQIFPGSVPIFRNNVLIGGIGVSGDGVDQDDLIAFRGLNDAGIELANGVGNAPPGIRADTIVAQGVRLRYVNCPVKPFLDSDSQNVCEGL